LAWQAINGESGIRSQQPADFAGQVFVDATSAGHLAQLPPGWSTALWNSKAWQGPAGLGIFAVADRSAWRNPLPHLDSKISNSEYSLPLAMASALALDAHSRDYSEKQSALFEINSRVRDFLTIEIGDVDIAGTNDSTVPHLLSFSILYVDAQRLLSELDRQGFAIDSGSACSSENLEPSHVLAAMGLLTHGNVRMTLPSNCDFESIERFLLALKDLVIEMRK
jgi:cysteine desulfurase